jgi:mono/diheme cytochrome c family protein
MRRWFSLAPLVFCCGCHTPSPENGALIYHNNCLVCHSLKPGVEGNGPSLAGYFRRNPAPTEAQAKQVILDGRRLMPAFRKRLTSAQVGDLLAYLKTR